MRLRISMLVTACQVVVEVALWMVVFAVVILVPYRLLRAGLDWVMRP